MDMSPEGLKKLIEREGMKLKAYRDLGKVWTICAGHTSAAGPPRVYPGMTATKAECMAMLKHDVSKFEDCVEFDHPGANDAGPVRCMRELGL